ncbi:MAG: hypothetical protein PHV82_14025 [Victivallaceae bacterium]|nr:hypothetical protein [Victivallaceae bacterium]
MNLKTLLDRKDYHSEKLGNLSRQMNYTAIAVVWIFSQRVSNDLYLPDLLRWVLLFCVASLLFEMFQYFFSYVVYDRYFMCVEKKIDKGLMKPDDEFKWHKAWPLIMTIFFYGKTVLSIIGFILLIIHIIG